VGTPVTRMTLAAFLPALLAGCTAVPSLGDGEAAVPVASRPIGSPAQHLEGRVQQAGFQQEAHRLHLRVQQDPDFGGIILRWVPEPHGIVMFTGDAEARLRRYTLDPRFKAQRVDLTLAELERMKDETGEQLARLKLKCFSVDGDEERNAVTVGAPPAELDKIRAAIAEGLLKAPSKLRFKEEGCPEFR